MTGEKQYFQFFYIRAYKIMEIKNSKKTFENTQKRALHLKSGNNMNNR